MSLHLVLRHIRRLAARPTDLPSDRELLQAFAHRHDEAAFAEVVRRHGPLVRGVARRVLGDADGADDVFQATFLVLARKAGSVRWGPDVGSWLSATAYRLACKARTATGRRRRHEEAAARARPTVSDPAPAWTELQAILDEELHRLPEGYRAPLLLCYFEGLTRDEAAHRLGWSFGTFCRRLAQGRDALRERLERRGATLGAVLFVAGAPEALTVAVPAALQQATVTAAAIFAAGGAITGPAVLLAETSWPMFGAAKMAATATVLTVALVAVGVGVSPSSAPNEPQPAKSPTALVPQPTQRVDLYGDPLPERAIARLGTLRLPDKDEVLTQQGRIAVLRDNRIAWLDPTTRAEIGHLSGPKDVVIQRFAVSPDGKRVVYRSDKDLWCWDAATDRELFHLVPGRLSINDVHHFSPDGRWLAWTTQVNMGELSRTHVNDATDGRELWAFGVDVGSGEERCRPLGFSPDGKRLITWVSAHFGVKQRLVVWSADSGTELRSIPIDAQDGRGVALAKNAQTLAMGLSSGIVRLWDLSTGQEMAPLDKALSPAEGKPSWWWQASRVAFTDQDRKLIVSHAGGTVQIWDWVNRNVLTQVSLPHATERGIRLTSDGQAIQAVLSGEHCWRTFDLATGQERAPAAVGHTAMLLGVKLSSDGRRVITAGQDNTIRIWEATTGRELKRMPPGGDMSASSFDISADSHWLATTNFNYPIARLLNAETGRIVHVLDHGIGGVTQVAISPDNRRLISVGGPSMNGETNDETTRVWDIASGRETGRIEGRMLWPKFALDGSTLYGIHFAGRDRSAWIVDLADCRVRRRIPLGVDYYEFAFATDQRSLVVASSQSKQVTWIELASGQVRFEVAPADGELPHHMGLSPDGRLLVTRIGNDPRVYLRDARTGQGLPPLWGHNYPSTSFVFSSDSRRLVSASADATALIWDVADLPPPRPQSALTPAGLDAAWAALADADAGKAYQALLRLADSPALAVPFLRQRLRPAAAVDAARFDKLLADLASPRFGDREAASAALAALDTQAEAALRRLLSGAPAAEARQRAEQLLARLEGPLTELERLREVRAVEALEQMATAEARELLQSLAGGAPDARSTHEAKDTELRLHRRAAIVR